MRYCLSGSGILVLLLLGCTGNLPSYSVLTGLRVLALQADQPEIAAGGTVTITPILSDIFGNGRALNYSAEVCLDPGVEFGASASCIGSPTRVVLGTNVSVGSLPGTFTGAAPATVSVPIPSTILSGSSTQVQYNGLAMLFLYTVTGINVSGGTDSITAYKRLIVVAPSKTGLNTNPTLSDILINGTGSAATPNLPTSTAQLAASYPAGAVETYQTQNSDGSFTSQTETLTTTWFISDGSVNYTRTTGTTSTSWSPPGTEPSGRKVVLCAVLRDNRGGIGFKKVEF